VTEEAGELSAAALAGSDDEVIGEAADLLYHALVLLEARGIGLGAVEAELRRRHRGSGDAHAVDAARGG
jgi:phosphoribosyl-ATP pyrophosphohydrolase